MGHSPEVNEYHYDPISEDVIQEKLNASTAPQLLPGASVKACSWSGWREENFPEHPNSSPFICKTSELKYMKK